MKLPRWLLYLFVVAVIAAWLTVIVAQVVNPEFKAPDSVNAIMTALSGAIATQMLMSNKKDPPDKKNDGEGGET